MTARWLLLGSRRVHPSVMDVLISVASAFFALGAHFRVEQGGSIPGTVTFALLGAAVVVVRRRWPVPVLIGVFVVLTAAAAAGQPNLGLLVFAFIAMFTVANQTDRLTTVVTGGIVAAFLYLGFVVYSGTPWDQAASVGILAWTGLSAATGDATRNRRSYVQAVEERARKAESERDTEAARQVAEERLRIARELHDVLAHHIAVIHVHAGLADATMTTSPDTSKESLGYIRQAAGEVLSELSALIPVLRSTEDGADRADDAGEPAPPAPGLARLDDLIDSHRRSGSPVRVDVSGKPHQLSAAADLAAYRIIQEALTNAVKHGVPGTTGLRIAYAGEHVEIRVTNLVATDDHSPVPGTGHGVIGMRERASSVGAELSTGRQRDVFTVDLRLAVADRVR